MSVKEKLSQEAFQGKRESHWVEYFKAWCNLMQDQVQWCNHQTIVNFFFGNAIIVNSKTFIIIVEQFMLEGIKCRKSLWKNHNQMEIEMKSTFLYVKICGKLILVRCLNVNLHVKSPFVWSALALLIVMTTIFVWDNSHKLHPGIILCPMAHRATY